MKLPLPSRDLIRHTHHGYRRARVIRTLYAERCNPVEIALALGTTPAVVARTLRRPVTPQRQPRDARGRWGFA
jgi:transposase